MDDIKCLIQLFDNDEIAFFGRSGQRVELMTESGNDSTAYDIAKKYTEEEIGKFRGADVVARCPGIGRSSALAALKTNRGRPHHQRRFGQKHIYGRADSK